MLRKSLLEILDLSIKVSLLVGTADLGISDLFLFWGRFLGNRGGLEDGINIILGIELLPAWTSDDVHLPCIAPAAQGNSGNIVVALDAGGSYIAGVRGKDFLLAGQRTHTKKKKKE